MACLSEAVQVPESPGLVLAGGDTAERTRLGEMAASAGFDVQDCHDVAAVPALHGDTGVAIVLATSGQAVLKTMQRLRALSDRLSIILVADGVDGDTAPMLRHAGVRRILPRTEDGVWMRDALALADDLTDIARCIPHVGRFVDGDVDLRRQMDLASAGITVIDEKDRIVASNPAFEQMLGHGVGGLVGSRYPDLVHPEELDLYRANWRAVVERGAEFSDPIERRFVRRDGSVVNALLSATWRTAGNGRRVVVLVIRDVGELRRWERALAKSEQRLRQAESIAGVGHWEQRGPAAPLICSDTLAGLFCLESAQKPVPDSLLAAIVEQDRDGSREIFRRFGVDQDLEFRVQAEGGAIRHLSCQVRPLETEPGDGEPAGNFGIVLDITARKAAELSLERERNFVSTVLDSEAVLLMVLDPDGHVVRWNKALSDLSGYGFAEVRGQRIQDFLLPPHEGEAATLQLQRLVDGGQPNTDETLILQKDGGVRIVAWSNTLVKDDAGAVEFVVSTGIDITERKRAEAVIRHQANYDSLTGLPNRTLFQDRLNQAIAAARRTDTRFALLYIDLDRFKSINDTLGHRAGDQLLVEAARRLETGVRETDTVARLGGDEFTVIVYDLDTVQECDAVARKVMERLGAPYPIGRREEFISCSIGITVFPEDGDTSEALMRNADLAMYGAKEMGRNGFVRFDAQMNVTAVRRKELERDLRSAVDEEALSIAFQPIVAANTGQVVAVEALLRWQHPELGNVRPDIFIPIAEETGLIIPLGEWVIRSVAGTVRGWDRAELPHVSVGVNVSTLQFHQRDFPGTVVQILEEAGLAPNRLTLEITESLMMEDLQIATEQLAALRGEGIHISVDDFGTGYSSLSYLKRLPVDSLKIDRSFVMGLPDDEEGASLVRAVIAMAHGFHLPVVAEGVETREQFDFLCGLGCDLAQGYLFGKPMSAEEMAQMLATPAFPSASNRQGVG